jgi:hypothetical protein
VDIPVDHYGIYRTTLMSSSNLPVDVLQIILEDVDEADLLTLCRVNQVCCYYSQDILYRNIYANSHFRLKVCRTLAQSTHLARRVRSFSVEYFHLMSTTDPPKDLAMAIQNMSSLRSLMLYVRRRYSILDECTFKLDSFITDFPCDEYLRIFLNSQPTLTHVELCHHTTDDVQDEFEATCLPNLTRVTAELPLLKCLIPGRPLSEIRVVGSPRHNIPSIDFFALSTAPIRKLTITSRYIYTTPIKFLTSIFPSLTHLSICMEPELSLDDDDVRGPLFYFSNHWILNQYHSRDLNGSKIYSLPWIHSESLTSIWVKLIVISETSISHLSEKLPLAFNTLPFTTANITIGNDSVGSGSFAKGRNVTKCR